MAEIWDPLRQLIRRVRRLGATVADRLSPLGLRFAPAFGGRKVKAQHALLSIAAALGAPTLLGKDAPGAEEASAMLSPHALQEIAQVEAEIDRIEAQMIERLAK